MLDKLFNISSFYKLIFVSCCLEILNMYFVDSRLNLLICIPEILFVLYLLLTGKIKTALLYHILFSLTTFSVSFSLRSDGLMSYSSLKLVGPFTISYILLGMIWLGLLSSNAINAPGYSLLYKTRKMCLRLFVIATIVGFLGIILSTYSFSSIIGPLLYMGICVIYLDIFARLYDQKYMQKCYYLALSLLISSPIASFLSYNFLGITALYSTFDTFIMNEMFMIAPLLILFIVIPEQRKIMPTIYLSIVIYFVLVLQNGRGGHFLAIAVSIFMFVYIVYFSKGYNRMQSSIIIRVGLPFVLFFALGHIITLSLDVGSSLASNKLSQFFSIFSLFTEGKVALDGMANSPYMRIAEFLNVFYSELSNPISLLIGKGYGGTYTDVLGLFYGIDLTEGSFSDKEAFSGIFSTAHSMYPNVLLYHGVLGLFAVIKCGFSYLKHLKCTPFLFAAFSLFLYSMYFNVLLLLACLLLLFAAELKIIYKTA